MATSARRFKTTTAEALAGLPQAVPRYPSPASWQDEVLYLIMPDRFSDGQETDAKLLDRSDLASARPQNWNPSDWALSGSSRFQGGTLAGVASKLDYLSELGITAIWLTPPWRQRAELSLEGDDSYHGYGVQNFLDVDPRFGTEQDLVDLVAAAHSRQIRVILDVLVNHSAENWLYQAQLSQAPVDPEVPGWAGPAPYPFGAWLDGQGVPLGPNVLPQADDDGVWPAGPLQNPDAYHRAGFGNYANGDDPDSAYSQFRWSDWYNRDLALTGGPLQGQVLQTIIDCWGYWLARTDCDGFRVDTFKHFRVEEGRTFCAAIRERAELLGKNNFLLAGEIGGGDTTEENYLTLDGRDLSAALEIGEVRPDLRLVAGGEAAPSVYFEHWPRREPRLPCDTSETPATTISDLPLGGSHRNLADAFVYTIDDHDNVGVDPRNNDPRRFESTHPGRTIPAVALLVFTLGIPCIYYGLEQGLALPDDLWNDPSLPREHLDRYHREAMFGPANPRKPGLAGRPDPAAPAASLDQTALGFGPFGTSGHHVFDPKNATYLGIQVLLTARAQQIALRRGRQYQRELRLDPAGGFGYPDAGGLVAWSRILAGHEVLCVANLDVATSHSADVTVDAGLNPEGSVLEVVADTAVVNGPGQVGQQVKVSSSQGRSFVTISQVGPAEVLVLINTRSTQGF